MYIHTHKYIVYVCVCVMCVCVCVYVCVCVCVMDWSMCFVLFIQTHLSDLIKIYIFAFANFKFVLATVFTHRDKHY